MPQSSNGQSPKSADAKQLQLKLASLAGAWRGSSGNTKQQHEIVQQYHSVIQQLLMIETWDGHIGFDAMLPDELMPEELFNRFPVNDFSADAWFSRSEQDKAPK
jgi:hypothetical protein